MSVFPSRCGRARATIALSLAVLAGLGTAVYLAVRTEGSPEQTATAFLTAWRRGDLPAMRAQVVEPPRDFEDVYDAFTRGSRARRITVEEIRLRPKAHLNFGESATYFATFSVLLDGPVPYRYEGQLEIIDFDRAWKIVWGPNTVHPDLQEIGSSEVRQIRVVPRRDGSSQLVLLERRVDGEGGPLFAGEGLKLAAELAEAGPRR
ncbi:NTF2-like N-terminal transpeptidase domain-containing protein [Nonomuraea sp. NPDC005692]|uniref:NTF2-like N-terminal transpeptidase domain-containing protein n=1 Tax=Nonomuraea sp. NPDC005692 TaxID=3157168 RepID=UPI0033E0A0D1